MKRRIAFVEFSILNQFPLVSGYLHAYAKTDPDVAKAFEFVYYREEVERVSYAETLSKLKALNVSILCFSCYVWNSGLIKRLVRDLHDDPRIEKIILGGHQISHHLSRYVQPSDHKVVVINGQGEIPFRAVLQRLASGVGLTGLQGVSFYTNGSGEIWNGGEAAMISNLDEIPSPFLEGYFDSMSHPVVIFETNRGCPYKCTFCTWGGDTVAVTKFSLDRIKEELSWISKKSTLFIYLADANWGMLPRDIEISEHIGRLKKDSGFPWMVYYAAAKNKPKGSVACIEKFYESGVITSQALGIQSMNPETLEMIDRKNIKNSAFTDMFDQLIARNIDSYCELIWPLPGETLDTLKMGFEQLLDMGARTVIMYPSLLINNSKLGDQTLEHEMETATCGDWKSELRTVKKTKYADRAAVDDGLWFYYSYFILANCDSNKSLLRYFKKITNKKYTDIVSEFARYLRENISQSSYAQLIHAIFEAEEHGSLATIGKLAAHLTHEARAAIQSDVSKFIMSQLADNPVRGLVLAGLWVFSLPKPFVNTIDDHEKIVRELDSLAQSSHRSFSGLAQVSGRGRNVTIDIRDEIDIWNEIVPYFTAHESLGSFKRINICHTDENRLPYMKADPQRNFVYAHGMIQRLSYVGANTSVS